MFRLFSFHHFFLVFYLKCFRFVLLLLIYLTINLILFSLNALCDLCECGLWGCLMLCLDPLLLKLCLLLLSLGFLVRRKGCLFIGIIQLYCFQKLIFFLLVIYLQKEYNQIHLFEFPLCDACTTLAHMHDHGCSSGIRVLRARGQA